MSEPEGAKAQIDTGTRLAYKRTYLAHERTQLAWVRTSLALITFGFGIAKFFQYLHETQGERAPQFGPRTVGMIMISIGLVALLAALVFVGLTAYDTQKIKNMYAEIDSADTATKKAIMGALTLYLDFINLFLMLLRLFGTRR